MKTLFCCEDDSSEVWDRLALGIDKGKPQARDSRTRIVVRIEETLAKCVEWAYKNQKSERWREWTRRWVSPALGVLAVLAVLALLVFLGVRSEEMKADEIVKTAHFLNGVDVLAVGR